MRRMPVPTSSTSRAGRSRSRAATFLVLALVATSFMAMPPAAAIDPVPADAPMPGQELVIDYHAEPEYLLTAGTERWNVRNTPDGTMASAYGVPEGAVHDLYAKTGRYEPLDSTPAGEILDVSVREKASDFGLDHSWAFVRKSDGNAEIWGPADEAYPDRHVLDLVPVDRGDAGIVQYDIVGGTVLSDSGGTPTALVVTDGGLIVKVTPGQAPDPVATVGGAGETVVGAVARDHTEYDRPALNRNTPRVLPPPNDLQLEMLPGTSANPPALPGQLMILFSSGRFELVPLDGDVTDAASLGSRPVPSSRRFDGASLGRTPNPIIDFDYSCFQGEYSTPLQSQFSDTESLEPFDGSVSTALGCPPGGEAVTRDGAVRSLGRISVAVGLEDAAGIPRVLALHSGDFVEYSQLGFDLQTRTFSDHKQALIACELGADDRVRAGTFDVRVLFATTYLGCVRVDPTDPDRTEVTTFVAPAPGGDPLIDCGDFELPSIAPPTGGCRPVPVGDTWTAGGEVQRRTFDPLADLGDGTSPDDPIVETYTDLESLSIQLEFPCERLLGRSLGAGADAGLFDCFSNKAFAGPDENPNQLRPAVPAASPNGIFSYAIAGYGRVDGERRLFVDHETDLTLFLAARNNGIIEDARQRGEDPDLPPFPAAEELSWVTEPEEYLASDLAEVAADPLGADVASYGAYAPPSAGSPPPVLLTQIPRAARTPMRIRIDSATPRVEEKPSMPIAVLQAPPTVQGLGQQTDFTPEFASSQSSGSESTVSKATRVGTHAEIEGVVTAGAGFLGNNARAGGGAAASYGFMNEVEEDVTNGFEVETTEGYGGAFDDHTVVTRSTQEYVWDATVLEDPSGFSTGQSFEYGIPAGEVTQAIPLSTLIEESPGLYGDGGVFRATIDAIAGQIRIGDPSSYPTGASSSQPTAVLRANGGPCSGGYAAPGSATPVDGRLRSIVSPDNPYFAGDPSPPTGPDVVVSAPHVVSAGNGLTESAAITFSSSTSESKATSKSHDWGITGIFKTEAEASAVGSVAAELTISAGVDSGFSTGAGVTDSLGEGSGLTTVMGNIPLSPADKPWVEDEQYTWRMYMCKAQLGPAGLGSEIWVQGYVVDGYNGAGGVEDLAPVVPEAPVASAVAFADPTQDPAGTVADCAAVGPRDNRFEWDQQAGTVDRYAIELTNVTGGGGDQRVVADLTRPADFDPSTDRIACAGIGAGDFVDGDLYRWRAVVDGFVDNRETSDWEFFRPQVWPPSQTISLRTPITNPDDSVSLDIDDPVGVKSLRHDVTVFAIDPETTVRTEVAARRSILDGEYRTPTLEPGLYEAEVVGHNSHVVAGGGRAETPPVTVQFQVEETLRSQFTYGGCSEDPCNTTDVIEFIDESLPANDVPIVAWSWYFGDGTTSTERSPTHRFTDLPDDGSGSYDVFLTITDAAGQTASLREEIPLQSAAPEIDTDGLETEIGVDQELTMELSASDPDNEGRDPSALQVPTFEWDLDGDGEPDVTEETFDSSVAHTFGAAGEYPVTVTVTDPFGRTDTHSFVVTVHAPPTADFTHTSCDVALAPDDPSCTPVGALVSFDPAPSSSTAGDLAAWEWDFGNGTTRTVTDPAAQVVEARYTEAGTVSINLRVQDRFGQWSGFLRQSIGIAPRAPSGGGGGGGGGAPGGGGGGGDAPVEEGDGGDEAPTEVVTVHAGTDRVGTAIAISESEFPDGSSSVVLADAGAYADALAGTPLAVAKDAPLLLTDTARVDPRVADEIARLLDPGGTVYVLGGPAALSEDVEAEVVDLGFVVERFAGATRYDTAVQIAEDGLGAPGTVLLTTGQGFADGLTAGTAAATVGGAVLLTDGDRLPAATAAYLDRHQVSTRYAVGGPAVAADPAATAIAGADRYATATALADAFFDGPSFVGLTSGLVFADALGGGVVAARHGGPLLLTARDDLPTATAGYLAGNAAGITEVQFYGGPSAISQAVRDAVAGLLAVSRALALVGP